MVVLVVAYLNKPLLDRVDGLHSIALQGEHGLGLQIVLQGLHLLALLLSLLALQRQPDWVALQLPNWIALHLLGLQLVALQMQQKLLD